MSETPNGQTPTPETEAAWDGYNKFDESHDAPLSRYETSCDLERRLTSALAKLAEAEKDYDDLHKDAGKKIEALDHKLAEVTRERDELDRILKQWTDIKAERDQWKEKHELALDAAASALEESRAEIARLQAQVEVKDAALREAHVYITRVPAGTWIDHRIVLQTQIDDALSASTESPLLEDNKPS